MSQMPMKNNPMAPNYDPWANPDHKRQWMEGKDDPMSLFYGVDELGNRNTGQGLPADTIPFYPTPTGAPPPFYPTPTGNLPINGTGGNSFVAREQELNAPPQGGTAPQEAQGGGFDWGGLFGGLLNAYGGYELGQQGIEGAGQVGAEGRAMSQQLGEEAANRAKFQPFTVTTGTGNVRTTPEGGIAVGLTRGQEDLRDQLLSQAQGLFGKVGVDPAVAQQELYEQMRAVQRPEEERKRLALEERMLSQGRMGLGSAAYGGSSPELLAQAQAEQEAMARANLGAREQAMAEQKQSLLGAAGLLEGGYQPQREVLNALAQGNVTAGLADIGRRSGADLYGQMGAKGIESYLQGAELANRLEQQQMSGMMDAVLGTKPTSAEKLLAAKLGIDPALIKETGLMSSLGYGDAPTPQWLKDLGYKIGLGGGDDDYDLGGEDPFADDYGE
jgi:hypothetical protein